MFGRSPEAWRLERATDAYFVECDSVAAELIDEGMHPAEARIKAQQIVKDRRAANKRLDPKGFTLVELLVVIGIMLLLGLLGVLAWASNTGSDRLRSAARITQSAFRGAVDRAAKAKQDRGLRLILDADDPSIATGFAYIWPMEPQIYGARYQTPIRIIRRDEDGTPGPDDPYKMTIEGTGTNWMQLQADGFISDPPRIRWPENGQFYGISSIKAAPSGTPEYIDLTGPVAADMGTWPSAVVVDSYSSLATISLELGNDLLPGSDPVVLPSGVVVDLDWSSPGVPRDIMFTPRGSVIRATAPIHLLLNDLRDATRGLNPIDPRNRGEKLIVTLFPQTGNIATFPIDPTDADADGLADHLYRFAELGSGAGQ